MLVCVAYGKLIMVVSSDEGKFSLLVLMSDFEEVDHFCLVVFQ